MGMTVGDRIDAAASRYRQRAGDRQRRGQALDRLRARPRDAPDLAGIIDEPVRIAARAVSAGLAGSTGEVLAGHGAGAGVLLERIIEETNLLPTRFLPAGARRAASVGRIVIRTPGGAAAGYGTGFLVAPDVMMTNNHVLSDADGAAASILQFDYVQQRNGQVLPVAVALRPDRLFLTDVDLDVTLVATAPAAQDGSEVAARGWVPLIGSSGKALVGERVNIIQHPRGEHGQIAIHDNTVLDVFDAFLHYETDTERGSSGSPVFNNDWDLAALHHAGVPARDEDGNILLTTGAVWDRNPATVDLISWVANEGVRISSIVTHLRQCLSDGRFTGDRSLLQAALAAADIPGPGVSTERRATSPAITGPRIADGRASWDLTVSIELADLDQGGDTRPTQPQLPDRDYYDPTVDQAAATAYYASIDPTGNDLFRVLSDLVRSTHTVKLTYREARLDHLYPVVDLHPDRQLRSVYSDAHLDPSEVIATELAIERTRQDQLREFTAAERFDPSELGPFLALLEADHKFNCEHVVPQSWFAAAEPMRSDLHHLFTCDPGCNSFRSNIPYWDFPEHEEAVRTDCGRTADRLKFEPDANHGAVARATLYFLLRYPRQIGDSPKELPADRLDVLLAWHTTQPPTDWERHRNAEIAQVQGNRNPLIDHPDWAQRVDFTRGFTPN